MKKVSRTAGASSRTTAGTKAQGKAEGPGTMGTGGKATSKTPGPALLSKTKSSDDLPAVSAGSGAPASGSSAARNKRNTISTQGSVEAKAKSSSGPGRRGMSSAVREPGPNREGLRERSRTSAAKKQCGPSDPMPPKRSRCRADLEAQPGKSRCDGHISNKAMLESRVKDLLGLAKSKDLEILHLRSELRSMRAQLGLEEQEALDEGFEADHAPEKEVATVISAADVESTLLLLQDQNQGIRGELNLLKSENRMLKDRLNALGFSLEQRLDGSDKGPRTASLSPEPAGGSSG